MIREYYQKHAEIIRKYVPVLIIILAVLSVVWNDCRLIRAVWDTGRQCYFVNERYVEAVPVGTAEYHTEFTAVGKQMLSIDISVSVGNDPKGRIAWNIEDSGGQVVLSEQVQDIADVLTEDMARLSLELPQDSLKQGEVYTLNTSFSDCGDVSLSVSEKGLTLIQYFVFHYKILFTVIIVLCSLIGFGILGYIYKRGLRIRSYVALSLFVGIMAVALIPPASRDDEFRHFVRVYTLARGQSVIELSPHSKDEFGVLSGGAADGDHIVTVPGEVNEIRLLDFYVNYNDNSYNAERNQQLCLDRLITIWKDAPSDNEVRVSCVATAARGLIFYWPQVATVWLGMKLGIRPLLLYYLARMGQMLVCVLFGALALKLASAYKDLIWLLSFIPNVIILKSCCNSDGLLIAEMMLLTAVVLWIREKGYDIISRKAIGADIAYLVLTYQIIKMKIPYALFCGAILLLLRKENTGKGITCWKKYWKILTPLASAAVVLGGVWVVFGSGSEFVVSKLYAFVPEWHVRYIMEHPRDIAGLFYHKFIQQVQELYQAMNGVTRIHYTMVIVISLLLCRRKLPHWKRVVLAGSFAVLVMTIILVGYTMTPPDRGEIWGITWRYMFPFLPIGALALPWGTEHTQRVVRVVYPAMIVVTVITSCTAWLVWLNRM